MSTLTRAKKLLSRLKQERAAYSHIADLRRIVELATFKPKTARERLDDLVRYIDWTQDVKLT